MTPSPSVSPSMPELRRQINQWARDLGFQSTGVSDTALSKVEEHLFEWLRRGYHGSMQYMERHGPLRARPASLVPGTIRIISVRMDYRPESTDAALAAINASQTGYIARYAVGRDYHRLIRRRLQRLADHITEAVGPFRYRAFTDSAPVMEKPLAASAGLGWIGKHTNLINTRAGSFFFLGELYTDLPLPLDSAVEDHCGDCTRCLDACPTAAIVAPYQLDARRCIAYLTIELKGSIPVEFRDLIGNRIFGCDDCQLVCPWNRFSPSTEEAGFTFKPEFVSPMLVSLLHWDSDQFERLTAGTALRRINHEQWLRNVAVALGNGPATPEAISALKARVDHPSAMVREHIEWALARLEG